MDKRTASLVAAGLAVVLALGWLLLPDDAAPAQPHAAQTSPPAPTRAPCSQPVSLEAVPGTVDRAILPMEPGEETVCLDALAGLPRDLLGNLPEAHPRPVSSPTHNA